ncbi:MAG: VWA domain-containing protein [Planctomycetota bacterium]|jgi:Mg-chelatase subunit ChlD
MLRFDEPAYLLLALLAVPLAWFGWRALAGMDRLRRTVSIALRASLLAALAIMLAGPHSVREHHDLTVIGVIDISGSVQRFADLPEISDLGRRSNVEYLRRWFREATQTRLANDRVGLIVFDGQAAAIAVPTRADYTDDLLEVTMLDGTNIEEAIRLGLAMFPADTARRLVLVTDGNETSGSAVEAARQAAGAAGVDLRMVAQGGTGVPIDVAPVAYRAVGDVQVVRIEAPPSAQPGQTVTVRILLESTGPATGRLTLSREQLPVDLNGAERGTARRVSLPGGQWIEIAQVPLGETPVNRFEAIFEPDPDAADAVPDNNRAEAFTATPSKGSVLVVRGGVGGDQSPLAALLEQAELPVQTRPPEQFPRDLLSLQAYDLIILDDIAAFELETRQHDLIARYVDDLGGGLIMVGGEKSFGAGGWNGTRVEEVLPLELDPPVELIRPSAALVLVLDKSGSMNEPVAGARASQQEVANEAAALAIESLRMDSLVGVVTFDSFSYEHVPLQRNTDSEAISKRVRAIQAEGGTNLRPALLRAHRMLKDQDVDRKRVVCLSDGRSSNRNLDELVAKMAEANIKLTTIAVGDDADRELLAQLADIGGGEFYFVRNPRTLPRVLVDSVQVLNKPLIKEVPFTPLVLPTGSSLTLGMDAAPTLMGLVVTAPRPDGRTIIEMTHTDGEPLLAHWQVGLGRVAAFTSDAGGPWSRQWDDWPMGATFWTQLARTIARPTTSRDAELTTIIEGDELRLIFEVTDESDGFLDYLVVEGTVYGPDGRSVPVRLRQTAPGRYEGVAPAPIAGNYIVALNPRRGRQQLAPVIGGISRTSSPEFRRYQSNLALLEEIVEVTDGRRLDIEDLAGADLFDRSGMPASVSILPAWQRVLWLALGLLLLDIASRRIAWDYAAIRTIARAAVRRVTPGRVKGRAAAATLASLRRVSDEFDAKQETDAAGLEKLEGTGRIMAPPPRPVPPPPAAARPKPDESRIRSAISTMLGRTTDETPAAPSTPAEEPAADEETDRGEAATETTSSLLAAKRRARERLRGRDSDSDEA